MRQILQEMDPMTSLLHLESTQQICDNHNEFLENAVEKFKGMEADENAIKLHQSLAKQQEQLTAQLMEKIKILKEKLEEMHRTITQHREDNESIKELQERQKTLMQILNKFETTQIHLEASKRKQEDEKLAQAAAMKAKYSILQHWSGLTVTSSKNGSLRFTFKNLHPSKPDKVYILKIHLDGKKYIVSDSKGLPGLEKLVDDLNATNDLMQFVARVRKRIISRVS